MAQEAKMTIDTEPLKKPIKELLIIQDLIIVKKLSALA